MSGVCLPNMECSNTSNGDGHSNKPLVSINLSEVDLVEVKNGFQDNLEKMPELEDSLAKLDLDNSSGEKQQTGDLLFKLEEIDMSDTKHCPPVVLVAGDRREIRPFGNKYIIDGKFIVPAKIDKWAIVLLFDKRVIEDVERGLKLFEEVSHFADCYTSVGRTRGVSVKPVDTIQYVPETPSYKETIEDMDKATLKKELRNLLAKLNDNLVDHAIIVLPEATPSWAHGYLQYLETTVWGSRKRPGFHSLTRTSRVQYTTLLKLGIKSRDRGRSNLIPALWLKYNTKLGGVNIALKQTFDTHELKFLSKEYLILSVDLCPLNVPNDHRTEALFSGLDIVAAVGMWDIASSKMKFRSRTRAQKKSINVTDIALLTRDILESFEKRNNGSLPKNIVIFRSVTHQFGVEAVAESEIMSIKKMLNEYCAESNKEVPKVTYLRVPKRKKFTKNDPVVKDIKLNQVQTGSLVDAIMSDGVMDSPVVVKPADSEDDPHKLTNFWVVVKVYDENDLSSLSIRAMIHTLSFLSPRTTAKTRPTPIDLADLANERTRHISAGWLEDRRDKYAESDARMVDDLNKFLSDMGDEGYRNSLYFI